MSNLIAIAYDDVATADIVRDKLVALQAQRVIQLEDAVVVERQMDGKIKLHQTRNATTSGAIGGALWGGLIGLIFFMPFLGAALGAATGAAVGNTVDTGADDNFMRQVGEDLAPGKAALFLLVVKSTPEKVIPEVAHYGGHIISSSLSPEAEGHLAEAMRTGVMAAHAPI